MSGVNLLCSAATSCGKWSVSPSAQSATRRRLAGSNSRCVEPPRAVSALSRQRQGLTPHLSARASNNAGSATMTLGATSPVRVATNGVRYTVPCLPHSLPRMVPT
jgi:hypothetical protein